MEIHNSKWIVTGPLLSTDVAVVFHPGGQLDFIERDEALGLRNPWRRIDNQVEFSVCNPITMMRHLHFSGRIYGNTIKGTCYKITGEMDSFEAVLIQSGVDPVAAQPVYYGSFNVSFFLAQGMNLN